MPDQRSLMAALRQYIADASPGGVLNPELTGQGMLDTAAISTMPVPIAGDIAGLAADANMYANEPEERTLGNYGLTAAGILPFIPHVAALRQLGKLKGEELADPDIVKMADEQEVDLLDYGVDPDDIDPADVADEVDWSLKQRPPAQQVQKFNGLSLEEYAEAQKRARERGFDDELFYHSTEAPDYAAFDPDKVDIGVHIGTPEQANTRLLDNRQIRAGMDNRGYEDSARIMPLRARLGNVLEMPDVGEWNDATVVGEALEARGFPGASDIMHDIYDLPGAFDSGTDWIESVDNREALDELREIILRRGYDSIKYKNSVEARGGLKAEIQAKVDALQNMKRELLVPAANGDAAAQTKVDSISKRIRELNSNPANKYNKDSYIILDPEKNLRSDKAKFKKSRGDLLSSALRETNFV